VQEFHEHEHNQELAEHAERFGCNGQVNEAVPEGEEGARDGRRTFVRMVSIRARGKE
jgi:hypothetical protein